jgi:hypothetical protein
MAEEKREGISTKINERLQKAKEHAKEKINPWSKTNKEERAEKAKRNMELEKERREAYRKEEIHQAAERGKHEAQHKYGSPQTHSATKAAKQTGRAASGVYRSGGKPLVNPGNNYYDIFSSTPPKKKPPPVVTTKVSKSGTVTITRPVEQEKKKSQTYSPFDMLGPADVHTPSIPNPFEIEIVKPHNIPHSKGHKKKRGAPKHNWNIGDLI